MSAWQKAGLQSKFHLSRCLACELFRKRHYVGSNLNDMMIRSDDTISLSIEYDYIPLVVIFLGGSVTMSFTCIIADTNTTQPYLTDTLLLSLSETLGLTHPPPAPSCLKSRKGVNPRPLPHNLMCRWLLCYMNQPKHDATHWPTAQWGEAYTVSEAPLQ